MMKYALAAPALALMLALSQGPASVSRLGWMAGCWERRRAGADSLVARIEGQRDGRTRGADFPFARAACPR